MVFDCLSGVLLYVMIFNMVFATAFLLLAVAFYFKSKRDFDVLAGRLAEWLDRKG